MFVIWYFYVGIFFFQTYYEHFQIKGCLLLHIYFWHMKQIDAHTEVQFVVARFCELFRR